MFVDFNIIIVLPTRNLMYDFIYLIFLPYDKYVYFKFSFFIILSWCFISDPTAMQFSDKGAIIQAIKSHNISKGVNYKVYELEAMTFNCK